MSDQLRLGTLVVSNIVNELGVTVDNDITLEGNITFNSIPTPGDVLTFNDGSWKAEAPASFTFDPLDPVLIGTGTSGVGTAGSVAIGSTTNTLGTNSVEIGNNSDAGGNRSIAIGFNAEALMTDSVALGDYSNAFGYRSVAIGPSTAGNTYCISAGFGANAYRDTGASVNGDGGSVAIGAFSVAANRSIAIACETSAPNNTGVFSPSERCTAIGYNCQVTTGGGFTTTSSTAIGTNVDISNLQSVGLGVGITISHQSCAALGSTITSSRDGQCLLSLNTRLGLGTERNTIYDPTTKELTYDPSSIRYKNVIQNLDDVSEKFEQLNPVRFVFKDKDTGNVHPMAKEQIGFIAEDMANIFPEFTEYEDVECTIPGGVSYPYITAMLTKQLQTERKTIQTQGNLIADLSTLLSNQGNLIANLQSRIIELETQSQN